jgi:hypothetical protein
VARAVLTPGIVEDEHDLGHPGGLASPRAVEDHVEHCIAAQALGGLLAEHPLERVDDVALAAAVGSDDAGNRRIEHELGPVGKALKTLDDQLLQLHRAVLRDRCVFFGHPLGARILTPTRATQVSPLH